MCSFKVVRLDTTHVSEWTSLCGHGRGYAVSVGPWDLVNRRLVLKVSRGQGSLVDCGEQKLRLTSDNVRIMFESVCYRTGVSGFPLGCISFFPHNYPSVPSYVWRR